MTFAGYILKPDITDEVEADVKTLGKYENLTFYLKHPITYIFPVHQGVEGFSRKTFQHYK